MKKILLTFVGIFAISTIIIAQDLKPNIIGIRAGLNSATIFQSYEYLSITNTLDTRISFNVGASYQRLLAPSIPLYLETGLYLTSKGGTQTIDWASLPYPDDPALPTSEEKRSTNLTYLQVPVLLNYQFAINDNVSIVPFAGLYAAYGLFGKYKVKVGSVEKSVNSFDDDRYNRFDYGLRFGVGATFYNIYAGIGYESGLADIHNSESKRKNRNWLFLAGYNFYF